MTRNHRAKKPVIRYTLEWSFIPESEHAILCADFEVNEQRFAKGLIVERADMGIPRAKQETEHEMREAIVEYFIRNKANVILVGPIEGTNE